MLARACYGERPDVVLYMILPDGGADVWLRKNIIQTADDETAAMLYEADEAYMRTDAAEREIVQDFEGWYGIAAAWQPPATPKLPTPEEHIAALEAENDALREQLGNTMDAVDYLLFGADKEA